mgnify:CR=1 FL=1
MAWLREEASCTPVAAVARKYGLEVTRAVDVNSEAFRAHLAAHGVELIVGSSVDPQFGPVLLFGAGGTMVEVFQDRALALPPLSPPLVEDWITQTKIHRALQGIRGQPPVSMAALADVLVVDGRIAEVGRGLEATMIEIRNDEILSTDGVRLWAGLLARSLVAAREARREARSDRPSQREA